MGSTIENRLIVTICFDEGENDAHRVYKTFFDNNRLTNVHVILLRKNSALYTADALSWLSVMRDNEIAMVHFSTRYAIHRGLLGLDAQNRTSFTQNDNLLFGTSMLTMHSGINRRLWTHPSQQIKLSITEDGFDDNILLPSRDSRLPEKRPKYEIFPI